MTLRPAAGIHPELDPDDHSPAVSGSIPDSSDQLIAMQQNKLDRPEKPERQQSPKVEKVLDLIRSLVTSDGEDQQIALAIVGHLERIHDEVVAEMQDDADARHAQIIGWAVDADRLHRSRQLLEWVDLK